MSGYLSKAWDIVTFAANPAAAIGSKMGTKIGSTYHSKVDAGDQNPIQSTLNEFNPMASGDPEDGITNNALVGLASAMVGGFFGSIAGMPGAMLGAVSLGIIGWKYGDTVMRDTIGFDAERSVTDMALDAGTSTASSLFRALIPGI